MIDAMEDRYVSTTEIPGAFLQTDDDKGDIYIKIKGSMANLLKDTNPACCNYFIYLYSRGNKCMYVEANKAIYGTLEASLLFWKNLYKSLE